MFNVGILKVVIVVEEEEDNCLIEADAEFLWSSSKAGLQCDCGERIIPVKLAFVVDILVMLLETVQGSCHLGFENGQWVWPKEGHISLTSSGRRTV